MKFTSDKMYYLHLLFIKFTTYTFFSVYLDNVNGLAIASVSSDKVWLGASSPLHETNISWLTDHQQVFVPVTWWSNSGEATTSAVEERCLMINEYLKLETKICHSRERYICQMCKSCVRLTDV